MGRKILCPHCKSTFDEDILSKRENHNVCPVCEKSLLDDEKKEEDELITWYYYSYIAGDGKTKILMDNPVDQRIKDQYKLIKEFKAPPKEADGTCDAAKTELRKYVPDAFAPSPSTPKLMCPRCFSTEFQLVPKRFSILTGFATNQYNRVCNKCGKKF